MAFESWTRLGTEFKRRAAIHTHKRKCLYYKDLALCQWLRLLPTVTGVTGWGLLSIYDQRRPLNTLFWIMVQFGSVSIMRNITQWPTHSRDRGRAHYTICKFDKSSSSLFELFVFRNIQFWALLFSDSHGPFTRKDIAATISHLFFTHSHL